MKSIIYYFVLFIFTTSSFAGGFLADIVRQISPDIGKGLDGSHQSVKKNIPIYQRLEENQTEGLQSYQSIKERNIPSQQANPTIYNRPSYNNVRYSYVCMTPYGSCPTNSYGISGSACYCSTPYGVYYGISQ